MLSLDQTIPIIALLFIVNASRILFSTIELNCFNHDEYSANNYRLSYFVEMMILAIKML